jgi:hypothetical protein
MPEMTIRLRINPETGKKDILVDLRSDEDALPHEHEQRHRQLVHQLIERGWVSEGEIGEVIVERESASASWQDVSQETPAERRSEQEGQ